MCSRCEERRKAQKHRRKLCLASLCTGGIAIAGNSNTPYLAW